MVEKPPRTLDAVTARHPTETAGIRPRIGLVLGPLVFGLMLLSPAPQGMPLEAWRTAAIGALMAIWWVTEPIPIPATALLPLLLFPLLGVAQIGPAAAPYADPVIFLFMGGFMMAAAMQRWDLHRRMALTIISAMGTRPRNLVGGFMAATAFLSMWVSNTATAVMMLPIGLSVTHLVREVRRDENGGADSDVGVSDDAGQDGKADGPAEDGFEVSLMLGIAYAASIGGFATLIGTPPNALFAGFMRQVYGVEIGFGQWMLVGVPLTLVVLPLCWLLLTRVTSPIRLQEIPGGRELIRSEMRALGPVSRPEKWILLVFTLTGLAWVLRPLIADALPGGTLSDAGIAIAAALVLFLIPIDLRAGTFVLNWEWASRLPWDVLVLFGGGLSLADAITRTRLAEWIGAELSGLQAWPLLLILLVVILITVALSELASNTATAAAFLPVVASLAVGIGENPLLLVVPAALAASCGFMMPVSTPPNAIAYGSGYVTIPQMARAGVWLDLICIAIITAMSYLLVGAVFGVEAGVVPAWAIP